MKRHEQRQKIFQLLFQIDKDIVELQAAKYYDLYQAEMFIKATVDYYEKNKETINEQISENLTGYTIDRISKVERNILRLALSELYVHNSPIKVIIDESVRLAKNYGDKDSHRFVNGVLKNFAIANEG